MQRPSSSAHIYSSSAAASSSSLFPLLSSSSSRPTTREGPLEWQPPPPAPASSSSLFFSKDRKASFSRKTSFSGSRRRGSSSNSVASSSSDAVVTDAATPPALPEYALAAAAKVFPQPRNDVLPWNPSSPEGRSKMLGRTATGMTAYLPPDHGPGSANPWQDQSTILYQQMTDMANKRISTLDYLRRAHEGRVYWFNTYLFDRPDLNRMSYFDPRKLARKATNHLLLGLSLPTIADLYSSTPLEFLRTLNALLSEFDSFQQLHSESSNSLSRARLPNMFRRPGTKSRRSTSASDVFSSGGGDDAPGPSLGSGSGAGSSTPSLVNFAAAESELLPGEEYTYLLTPSLPFEPDFFETFATLCDTLIDTYTRFLALVPTARECSPGIAELFSKADARVRRILVQGIVKEFEDHSKVHVKTEMASIGKVVLSGLM